MDGLRPRVVALLSGQYVVGVTMTHLMLVVEWMSVECVLRLMDLLLIEVLLLLLLLTLLMIVVHGSHRVHLDILHLLLVMLLHLLLLLGNIVLRMHQISLSLLVFECFDVLRGSDLQILLQQSLKVERVLLRTRNAKHNHRNWIFVDLFVLILVAAGFGLIAVGARVILFLELEAVRLLNLDVGGFLSVGAFLSVVSGELLHVMRLREVISVVMLVLTESVAKSDMKS